MSESHHDEEKKMILTVFCHFLQKFLSKSSSSILISALLKRKWSFSRYYVSPWMENLMNVNLEFNKLTIDRFLDCQEFRLRLQGERTVHRGCLSAESVPGLPVHEMPAGQYEERW